MNTARAAPVAVRLENGRVMVIGGADQFFNILASAEIYDPSTNSWSLTASMNDARFEDFPAVLLPRGKVLVAGGTGIDGVTSLSSPEIFDEATGNWTSTGSMNVGRGEFANVVLNDGRVLVVGGITELSESGAAIASAEIYDPVSGTWTLTGSMSTAREDPQRFVCLTVGFWSPEVTAQRTCRGSRPQRSSTRTPVSGRRPVT